MIGDPQARAYIRNTDFKTEQVPVVLYVNTFGLGQLSPKRSNQGA
jgi:hypothetical protein